MKCFETFTYTLEPETTFPPDVPFNTEGEWEPAEYTIEYDKEEKEFILSVTWTLDIDVKWGVIT